MRRVIFAVVLTSVLILASAAVGLAADPTYKTSSTFGPMITGGITDEFVGMIREDKDIAKGKPLRIGKDVGDEDLRKLVPLADVLTGLLFERNDAITDLSPLSALTGLTYLKLDSLKGVTTLAPLGALVNMKELEIRGVQYPDLGFLSGMNDLESLVFFMMPPEANDASPLKGKVKLKKLHFYGGVKGGVKDISMLADMKDLEDLSLYMTSVEDLSPISGLTGMKRLNLYGIPATDMSPVGNLTELTYIWIYATKFKDYSPLAKLTKLEELAGGISALDTLEYVESMPNLNSVSMLREEISDYSPLSKCPELAEVNLESMKGGPIDLSVFSEHKKLVNLFVRGSEVKNAPAIAALPKLEWLILIDTTGIDDVSVFKDLPKLKRVSLKKGQFPDAQIEALGDKAQVQ